MTIEDKIAGMCLFGFICKESKNEQIRCLNAIELNYGLKIANIVQDFLKK